MSAAVLGHLDAPTTIREKKMLSKALTVKAGVVAGVVLLGAGSAAAAATGSLPTQAQSAVHNALSHLDISVPNGSNPSEALSNSHALPGICNAAAHNGTLSTSSTHKPNEHSVFGSVTSTMCHGVPAPGQSGTNESNESNEPNDANDANESNEPNDANDSNDSTDSGGSHSTDEPSSTPSGPPSDTPGSGHASVSTPDEGSSGSGQANSHS